VGIELWRTENSKVLNNTVGNNRGGIILYFSSKNTITGNTVSNNYPEGIYSSGSDNLIYLNNFINNTDNVHSSTYYESTNIWNSTEEITYYNDKYTNYLGNYWDDYTGSDKNNDGIGDTPYNIDRDKDYYPLMERYENYV
jgi:parallel beta-helix repeat protein